MPDEVTLPPVKKKHARRISRRMYAKARANGATQLQALHAAGSSSNTSAMASRMEREPRMQDLLALERKRVLERAEQVWSESMEWMHEVASSKGGKIRGSRVTNLDRASIANTAGRTVGAFIERRETHITHHHVPFRSMIDGTVIGGEAKPALPPGEPE